jgi:hypothetical protein
VNLTSRHQPQGIGNIKKNKYLFDMYGKPQKILGFVDLTQCCGLTVWGE